MAKSAIVLIAPGFEEIEAITPIDILRRAGIKVTTAGLHTTEVEGAHGITITCDTTISQLFHQPFDAIVLPGGMPGTTNLFESNEVRELIHLADRENKIVAAICAAPLVLDASGALNKRSYTCYPGTEKKITNGVKDDAPVVIDENIITGRAAGSAIDFSLAIVSELLSESIAQEVKEKIVY